jgi:transcriptional regulator with XRE-family HTH domain
MLLSDYMQKLGLSDDTLADDLDVSRSTISRLRRGVIFPSFVLALRIHDYTGGKVTPNDFLVTPSPAPARRGRPAKTREIA